MKLRISLLVLLLWAYGAPAVWAQRAATRPEWGLPSLMAALSQVRSANARFVETKYLHLLSQAQRSSGRLSYVAPDWFRKETLEPALSRLTIHGGRLTVERQGEPTREFSMRDYPEFGGLIESIQATLSGDLPSLNRDFGIQLDGNMSNWVLTLTPREAKPRSFVSYIRIRGQQTAIVAIETIEPDGDRTETLVTPEQR